MDADSTVIVMGVAGVGKTTLGCALATRLGRPFLDADMLHAPEAVERMRRGEGLSDAERAPWLDRVAERVARARADGRPLVVACSALGEAHRARLRAADAATRFVWLDAPPDVLRKRLEARAGHFAGAALLTSQLAALQPPADAVRLNAQAEPDALVEAALRSLQG